MPTAYSGPTETGGITPDPAVIAEFLQWWFARCDAGVIEITHTDPLGRGLTRAAHFPLEFDGIADAALYAAEQNAVPGTNVYFGCSTVADPAVTPRNHRRASDADAIQTPGLWLEQDDADHVAALPERSAALPPSAIVITGEAPHKRQHIYVRLDDPADPALAKRRNQRLIQLYGGSPESVNPARVLRLPGCIAWPYKRGRTIERTSWQRTEQAYNWSQVAAALPPEQAEVLTGEVLPPPDKFHDAAGRLLVAKLIASIRAGNWDTPVFQLINHKLSLGESDAEIHLMDAGITLPGYTLDDTAAEVQAKIDWSRQTYARPDQNPYLRDRYLEAGLVWAAAPPLLQGPGVAGGVNAPAMPGSKPPLKLTSVADIAVSLDSRDFVQGTLLEESLAVVYGESNAGKTFWLTDLALHVASGETWQGCRVEQGGVVYCTLEGGHGFNNRVAAWKAAWIRRGSPGGRLSFVSIQSSLNLLDASQGDVDRLIVAIHEAAATLGTPVKLVVIDTLARAFAGGNENASEDMGRLVINTDRIREATRSALAFVHHAGKDAAKGARGHSSLRAACDTEIEVVADAETGTSRATIVKQRDLAKGGVFEFALARVVLGTNKWGEDVTTCLVEGLGAAAPSGAAPPSVGGQAGRALGLLRDMIHAEGRAGGDGVPPHVRAITSDAWREQFYRTIAGDADPGARRKAFNRAKDALAGKRLIGMYDRAVWIPPPPPRGAATAARAEDVAGFAAHPLPPGG